MDTARSDAVRTTPRYSELRRLDNGLRASWGVFGAEDDAGSVNFLTPEAVIRGARHVVSGESVNISLPLNMPDPPFYGRSPMRHVVYDYSPTIRDDFLDNFYLQGSTQWDGLRHVRDPLVGFYNGVSETETENADGRLGIEAWAERGIIGRGVFIDVALLAPIDGYDPLAGTPIGRSELENVLQQEGVELAPGDILMVRTGYMGAYLQGNQNEREEVRDLGRASGISADEEVASFLWDNQVSALVVDNPGVEHFPRRPPGNLHALLVPMLGFAIGEFFNFEALSKACELDGRYTSLFVSVPLNLPGGIGSPANAVVIR